MQCVIGVLLNLTLSEEFKDMHSLRLFNTRTFVSLCIFNAPPQKLEINSSWRTSSYGLLLNIFWLILIHKILKIIHSYEELKPIIATIFEAAMLYGMICLVTSCWIYAQKFSAIQDLPNFSIHIWTKHVTTCYFCLKDKSVTSELNTFFLFML